jgi:hypothetical protein
VFARACTRPAIADRTVMADRTAQPTAATTAGFRCSAVGSACGIIEQEL